MKVKSNSKTAVNGFIWIASGAGIEAILKIIVLAVMARLITPEEFGIAGAALIVIGFSQLITQLGVGPAIVQRKELLDVHIYTGFSLSVFMGFCFTLLLYFTAEIISNFFGMNELTPILKVLALVFIIESLAVISQSLVQRNMRFKLMSTISAMSFFIGYGIVGIVLSFLDFGVWALIYAHIAQTIIRSISIVIVQKHTVKLKFDIKAFKELIYFGGGFTIARIANYFAGQGDNIVIGRSLGASSLGVYGRAYQFIVMPVTLIGTALDKVLFPIMAKIQNDKKQLENIFIKGINGFSIITFPLSVFVIILAPEIVHFVLGNNWTEVIVPFQILSLGLYFRVSYRISDSLARALGNVYKRALIQIVYATSVILGSWIGQYWGIKGVSTAVFVAIFINFILLAKLSIDSIQGKWNEFLRAHVKGLILALILLPIIIIFTQYLRIIETSAFLILVIISSTTLLIISSLFKLFPKQIFGDNGIWLINIFIKSFKK